MSITFNQSFSSVSWVRPIPDIPAKLIPTSILPNAWTACSTVWFTCASSLTLSCIDSILTLGNCFLISSAVVTRACWLRSVKARFLMPYLARLVAHAFPSPVILYQISYLMKPRMGLTRGCTGQESGPSFQENACHSC